MPKGSNRCQDCGEWRSFTKPHYCRALHASPDTPGDSTSPPARTVKFENPSVSARHAGTGGNEPVSGNGPVSENSFEAAKQDYREALKKVNSMNPEKFDRVALYNSIVELSQKAEKYSTTANGYAEVLLDVDYFADNGNFDRATILRTSADRGHRNAEKESFSANIPKPQHASFASGLHIPEDTFPSRLEKLRDAERVLEKHEQSYEEAFRVSGGLVYPENMCVSCGHYHNSGLRKTCLQKECGCRKHYPATKSMDAAFRAFEGLEEAQRWREACLADVKKVYPGDKWFIAYGNLVGEKGVSMKVEETQSGPRVSILTYSGKNFWAPYESISRDVHGTIPGEFDPH